MMQSPSFMVGGQLRVLCPSSYLKPGENCIVSFYFPGKHAHLSSLAPVISSVQLSHSIMSESLQLHGLQHTRHTCQSPTPRVYPNSCPLSRWCHSAISSSVIPFSSHLQSFPASGSFLMSQLFASGGQSVGVSASESVLPMNTQGWSPLGWTGWICLESKGLSRVFSNTTVQKHHYHLSKFHIYVLIYRIGVSSSWVWMWKLDHEEGWALKNWCFQILVLEKALESPLDGKEIKPVNPKPTLNIHWKDWCWS